MSRKALFDKRNRGLDVQWIATNAAIAAARFRGRGDKTAADYAAVAAVREGCAMLEIAATCCFCEGAKDGLDQRGRLLFGEKLGKWGDDHIQVDLGADPIDGTTRLSKNEDGAVSVFVIAEEGTLARLPDTKMLKLAVGADAAGVIDITMPIGWNLQRIAQAKGKPLDLLNVVILDRPRHKTWVDEIRATGATVKLIGDCDLMPAVATCDEDSGIDVLYGTGGAPEGVLSAAAIKCLGGNMQGKIVPNDEADAELVVELSGRPVDHVYLLNDMVGGSCVFCATAITDTWFMKGVVFKKDGRIITNSVVTRTGGGLYKIEKEIRPQQ